MTPRVPPVRRNDGWRAALAACLLAGPALAADVRPALLPARDAAVTYRVAGGAGLVRVAFRGGGGAMRFEMEGQASYGILDRQAGVLVLVLAGGRLRTDLPVGDEIERFLHGAASADYARRGEDVIAGQRCTIWQARAPEGDGTGCLTADGVLLRGTGQDRQGHTVSLEAVDVSYAPLPPAAFVPPAGARRFSPEPGRPLPEGAP